MFKLTFCFSGEIALTVLVGLVFVSVNVPRQATAHILECYECATMKNNDKQNFEDLRRDPCFNPIGRLNVTQCPHGTSCYKQETTLYAVQSGQNDMSESYVAISRFCGSLRFTNECQRRIGANSVITTCACTTDVCNTASGLFAQIRNNRFSFVAATLMHLVLATLAC